MTDAPRDDPMLLLHAALDGELDAAGMIEIEARLAADPALAAEYARLAALRDAIRTRLPRAAAPDALRARVIAMAQAPTVRAARPRRAASVALLDPRYRSLAASLVLGIVLGRGRASDWLSLRPPTTTSSARSSPALSGAACPASRRCRDLGSPYGQTLAGGQDRRRDDRRRSQGGRISAGRRAHRRGRQDAGSDARLSAPRAPDRAQRIAGLGAAGRKRAAPATRDGYGLVEWEDGGRLYAAVSDMPPSELDAFGAAFRRAAAAEREEAPKP